MGIDATTAGFAHKNALTKFGTGFVAALAAVLLIGEAVARFATPTDVRNALQPDARQPRIYKPDPQIGADFKSYEGFRALNAHMLDRLGPLDMPKPTWLLFGNSFVQGPGHLADTAERNLPDKRIFALRQHVETQLRAAEARQLLSQGLRPERIFFVMLPIDTLAVGRRPLSFIEVLPDGAMMTRIRWPDAPWTDLVKASRLATTAWIRSGRAAGDPSFDLRRLNATPPPRAQADLLRIFNHLAETSRTYKVPVTVTVLPDRAQIFGQAGFGFQETVAELSKRAGLDFLDARRSLVEASDKRSLFVPDWHFNERGNLLVLQELLDHAKARAAGKPAGT